MAIEISRYTELREMNCLDFSGFLGRENTMEFFVTSKLRWGWVCVAQYEARDLISDDVIRGLSNAVKLEYVSRDLVLFNENT